MNGLGCRKFRFPWKSHDIEPSKFVCALVKPSNLLHLSAKMKSDAQKIKFTMEQQHLDGPRHLQGFLERIRRTGQPHAAPITSATTTSRPVRKQSHRRWSPPHPSPNTSVTIASTTKRSHVHVGPLRHCGPYPLGRILPAKIISWPPKKWLQ